MATTEDQEQKKGSTETLVLQVLAFAATGIGILGFVTFFGGALLWVRADQAGIPANEAVAVIPKGVLVTTGASFLVPALLLALGAAAAIYAIHFFPTVPTRIKQRKASREALELREKADKETIKAEGKRQLADLATELKDDAVSQLESDAEQASKAAVIGKEKAQQAQLKLDLALRVSPLVERRAEYVAVGLVIALAPVLIYGVGDVGRLAALGLLIGAAAAAAVSLIVYRVTEKFVLLGLVAFVTVGIYAGAATYARTVHTPKVEPAAVLRGDRPPVTGFFIADTASNVYLGTFSQGQGKTRLVVIPQAQVTDLAVGPLLGTQVARQRAVELALDECQQTIAKSRSNGGPQFRKACSRQQLAALKARLD
jgi:hypothetical protein